MRFIVFALLFFQSAAFAQTTKRMEISFPLNSPNLSDRAIDSINGFFEAIGGQRILSVRINGFSYEEGGRLFNLSLSVRRARAVYEQVEGRRARREIITYKGYGDGTENVPDDRKQEHRNTELIVTFSSRESPARMDRTASYQSFSRDSIEVGKKIRVKNMNFVPGDSRLLSSAMPALNDLERLLKENPTLEIEIDGHVCCNNNMQLSIDRAFEVYDQLVSRGIARERLSYKGFSNKVPIGEEETDEGREVNRRVEIRILKK